MQPALVREALEAVPADPRALAQHLFRHFEGKVAAGGLGAAGLVREAEGPEYRGLYASAVRDLPNPPEHGRLKARWKRLTGLLYLHRMVIAQSGGSSGVRDLSRLESAIAQPMATFTSEGEIAEAMGSLSLARCGSNSMSVCRAKAV